VRWKGAGRPDVREQLFGGRGRVSVWSLAAGALAEPFEVVLGCELAPSSSVGAHVQQDCSELVVVTEGRGEARVDGGAMKLAPGVVVAVPLGAALELVNRSKTKPLRYLIVKAATPASRR